MVFAGVKRIFNQKVIDPVKNVIKAGITPRSLALSVAVGFVCGLFPIPGTTSLITLIPLFFFDVNAIICQVVNFMLTPLEIAMVPVFMSWGQWIYGAKEGSELAMGDLFAVSYCYLRF
eukprot:TRINITY_DN28834_c0_g1_i2.p1 TRINITY_DN28834_c0_g1~~TRINITY_DN28834_c0_g1_i2.p1  ORF type:complete len:118 (-),score=16.27 TRINITY_DN28834_c0_g1_i2:233-586(-)